MLSLSYLKGVNTLFVLHVNEEMTLRMLSARDAEPLYQITDESREYLKKWLPWLDDINSANDSLMFIKNSFQIYNDRKGITAGIFIREKLVGVISFNELDFKNNIGYIGYWLAEKYQGKGIMTTAVSAFITYGFTELSLNRIDLRAASGNKPSRRIAERLGFKKEGRIRQVEQLYDHYVDHIIYGMLQEEWENK